MYSWADCAVILHAAHTDHVLAQEISLGERLEWHPDVYNWISCLTKQLALVIINGLTFISAPLIHSKIYNIIILPSQTGLF